MSEKQINSSGEPIRWLARLVPISIAAVLVLAFYVSSIGFEVMIVGDGDRVFRNPVVTESPSLGATKSAIDGQWAPLGWLATSVEHTVFGMSLKRWRLASVVLFATAVVVWGLAFSSLGLSRLGLFAALAFWALHPARVEAVAWLAEQKMVMATLLLGVWASLTWGRPFRAAPWVGVVFFVLAILVDVVAFPAALATLVIAKRGNALEEERPGQLIARRGVVIAMGIAAFVMWRLAADTIIGYRSNGLVEEGFTFGLTGLGAAVRDTFWPMHLVPDATPPAHAPVLLGLGVFLLALAITALVVLLWKGRSSPIGRAAGIIVWFVVCVVPFCGWFSRDVEWMSSRWLLVAHLGLALGFGFAMQTLAAARSGVRHLAWVTTVSVMAFLALASWQQLGLWSERESFADKVLRADGEHFEAMVLQAGRELGRGDAARGNELILRAREMRPAAERPWLLSMVAAKNGGYHLRVLELASEASVAGVSSDNIDLVESHSLRELGRVEEAMGVLKRLLDRDPDNEVAIAQLAQGYLVSGDVEACRKTLAAALKQSRHTDLLIARANLALVDGDEELLKAFETEFSKPSYANYSPAQEFLLLLLEDRAKE